jgi:DNA-directed RNA polymerase subunit M/transcription elongation factor TFIIS
LGKSICKVCGQSLEDFELDDHLNQHADEPEKTPVEKVPLKCPDCNVDTEAYYAVPFVVRGRSDAAARLLVGWAWAELGENPILIDLYACPKCGRLQQFASKETRDRLRRSAKSKSFGS